MIFLILFFTVFISGLAGLWLSGARKNQIRLLTAFSGAYLLGLSILHLLPEVYAHDLWGAGYFILAGFLLQVVLEFFSGGVEHGHGHAHPGGPFPYAMLISLCIHSFVEAMPLATGDMHGHTHEGTEHSLTGALLTGIVLHKIPVSLVLVIMLVKSGISRNKILATLFIFAAMAPLGAVAATIAGDSIGGENFFSNSLAIVIGIFLHISTTILFEASENHRFHLFKMAAIITGLLLAVAGS